MGKIHFISGKGGVGKSSVAAATSLQLAREADGPVLLIDMLGSGFSYRTLGHKKVQFQISRCYDQKNLWVSRIEPQESFKEYLGILLSLGIQDDAITGLTSRLREGMTEFIAHNKIVKAFVRACPGLEPIVMLGKVCWEARKGEAPEVEIPWAHIVVDAPSSGHFLQLFKSTEALVKVFPKGPILTQAKRILEMVRNPESCSITIVSLAEELPLKETLELNEELKMLQLPLANFIVNKFPFDESIHSNSELSEKWQRQVTLENEILNDKRVLIEAFKKKLNRPFKKVNPIAGEVNLKWIEKMLDQIERSPNV